MVEELGHDVSTGLFTTLTMEERGKGRGRKGDRQEGRGRQGGRRKGMNGHSQVATLLECNSS